MSVLRVPNESYCWANFEAGNKVNFFSENVGTDLDTNFPCICPKMIPLNHFFVPIYSCYTPLHCCFVPVPGTEEIDKAATDHFYARSQCFQSIISKSRWIIHHPYLCVFTHQYLINFNVSSRIYRFGFVKKLISMKMTILIFEIFCYFSVRYCSNFSGLNVVQKNWVLHCRLKKVYLFLSPTPMMDGGPKTRAKNAWEIRTN